MPTTPTVETTSNNLIDTSFVPADLDAGSWEVIEPYFQALLDRPLNSVADLERFLLDRSELESAISESGADRYINMTCHTDDEEAKKAFLDFVENIEPKVKPIGFELDKKYIACPFRSELDQDRYLVLDRDTKADVEIFRDENVPLETELSKLSQQFSEVSGAMSVEFDGEEKTMPQMATYVQKTDRAVRESAWRAMADRRLHDVDRLNDIFDEMIKIRNKVAVNAGFDNYRDYMFHSMHRFDYTPSDCERFHEACEKAVVPVARKLNEERKETLGVDTLRPWDLAVDVKGREPLRPFKTADELVDGVERIYHKMEPSLSAMFRRLREPGCLDLSTRKGKAPGGYQYNRDRKRQPFIFMNAAGMQRDVETLLHEGGHAFHSILSETEPLLHYRHAPMEFAEVASMSMELTAHPFMNEFYTEEEAGRAVREHLEGVVSTLPWIATIDAFQHWIYTNPDHSRTDREKKWLELTERFGPAVDYAGIEKYRPNAWQRQLHLFEVPFYYIEYGIAQLGALQLWLQYKDNPKQAIDNYKRALSLGGSKPLPQLFQTAGLRFDFGPETVKTLLAAVEDDLKTIPV